MSKRNPIGAELADEALANNPNLPTLTIARELFQNNPGVWSSIEHCRIMLRYRRGASGEAQRKCKPQGGRVVAPPSPLSMNRFVPKTNPFMLPDSFESPYEPFHVSTNKECQILVLSDIHIPYHSMSALSQALKEGKRRKVAKIILNGDTIDCHTMSRFEQDPRARTFAQEINAARQFTDALREEFPKSDIIWKDGNHDERYDKFMARAASELLGLKHFNFENVLGLNESRTEYVSDQRIIMLGHLHLLHGHELLKGAFIPVNPARSLFLRAKASSMIGHFHKTSEHTENTLDNKTVTCWSTGSLCELHPRYARVNGWNHGFAIVHLLPSGEYHVENLRIIDGKVY